MRPACPQGLRALEWTAGLWETRPQPIGSLDLMGETGPFSAAGAPSTGPSLASVASGLRLMFQLAWRTYGQLKTQSM